MPAQRITPSTAVRTGVKPTAVAVLAANGGIFQNGTAEKTVLRAVNTTGSPINITFTATKTVDSLAAANRVVAVPANDFLYFGPFPAADWNMTDNSGDITFAVAANGLNIEALVLP